MHTMRKLEEYHMSLHLELERHKEVDFFNHYLEIILQTIDIADEMLFYGSLTKNYALYLCHVPTFWTNKSVGHAKHLGGLSGIN